MKQLIPAEIQATGYVHASHDIVAAVEIKCVLSHLPPPFQSTQLDQIRFSRGSQIEKNYWIYLLVAFRSKLSGDAALRIFDSALRGTKLNATKPSVWVSGPYTQLVIGRKLRLSNNSCRWGCLYLAFH